MWPFHSAAPRLHITLPLNVSTMHMDTHAHTDSSSLNQNGFSSAACVCCISNCLLLYCFFILALSLFMSLIHRHFSFSFSVCSSVLTHKIHLCPVRAYINKVNIVHLQIYCTVTVHMCMGFYIACVYSSPHLFLSNENIMNFSVLF